MNHKHYFFRSVILLLVMLIVGGCAATEADVSATLAPQTCPTAEPLSCPSVATQVCPTNGPQSCPNAAIQAVPARSSFQSTVASMVNATITFEAGDKCSIQIYNPVQKANGLKFEVVVNDNTYQDYIVWFYYVDAGKTLEDLKTQDPGPFTPAPFIHLLGAQLATPMSRTFYASPPLASDANQGPIFFTCQVDGPVPRKQIDHLGPLEVTSAP